MASGVPLPSSPFYDDSKIGRLRKDVQERTRWMFDEGDLAWLCRRIKVSPDSSGPSVSDLRDLVWDTLWTVGYNEWDATSFADVQGLAGKYMADSRWQCTRLRNFFLYHLLEHMRRRVAVSESSVKWSLAWLAVLVAGALLAARSGTRFGTLEAFLIGCGALGLPFVLETSQRLWRAARVETGLGQVTDEVGRGAFDQHVTEQRISALEGRRLQVPSIVYTLLRQPALSVEQAFAAEWTALPRWHREQINSELIDWQAS